jgi:hypothetical protein
VTIQHGTGFINKEIIPYKEKLMSDMPQTPKTTESPAAKHGRAAWFGGAVLIIVGLAFIVDNLNLPFIKEGNWWAVFLLIPIVAILDDIYRITSASSEGKAGAITSKLVGLLIIAAIMIIFLFGINLGIYWPVLLIAAGLVFLIAALVK